VAGVQRRKEIHLSVCGSNQDGTIRSTVDPIQVLPNYISVNLLCGISDILPDYSSLKKAESNEY
jgi:hypothetical protein